ncbi:hypothetical protein N5C55_19845 [Pseudomonas otitidis]|uniref:hypothetical protein n=1 Tax=Metapseudomonas otitidis TaxID=319939 RepID=UPI0024495C21|nr:hypothetical protein [Pseudomonas otitidis]MDH1108619.1 hypothetical protein [Pseudomonas otitidis]MDH1160428.1 hypothetical protein [Pseudomonas otitidis]MDH1167677.1 hypothetical protein [Pseudomonas otitidis]
MPRTLLYLAIALVTSGVTLAVLLRDAPSAPAVTQLTPLPAPPTTPLPVAPVVAASPMPVAVNVVPAPHVATVPVADAPADTLIELWDSHSLVPEQQQEMTLYRTQVATTSLGGLSVGKTLQLGVPGRQEPLRATLDETHNTGGAAVWSGPVEGGQPEDTLTVVQGQLETHITLATREQTLSMVVDNATGSTLVTDQNQLLMRATPDVLISPDSTPLQPLPPPTRG